ncbi:sensor histidine kinase [Marinilabilia salmonicolor]|jgi:ligand-binding sensor domain-containing protein/signal transduction histidine kinase|uniref:histidine kinase n=1 Tax=Marinilabilia salmonicolor TaxID=989 RepID=A0A2T0XRX2_9BACT|nr:sensor histidine kinase [Marinilabilia salmonicolor]PRZ01704.1 signal transduction histidine kinase [Marinilabilia salmonicolor]RCW31643.1 signal transduction histidine kinase [Marinilabilia salmonicolor]
MKFRHFTSKDGLVQNNVVVILQDSKGFMWFGTRAGLNRFDGYDYRLYEYIPGEENTLISSQISALYEDKRGYIWIGHEGGGLDRYNPETDSFENFNRTPETNVELPNSNVSAITEDDQENLWIGTFGNGMYVINKARTRMTHLVHDPENDRSLGANSIRTLLKDSSGNLWVGFWSETGIDRYDPETGVFHHLIVREDKEGVVTGDSFYDIYEDSKGRIWISLRGVGVSCYYPEENRFENYSHDPFNPNSLSSNVVRAIVEDDEGNLWFGTENGGLSILNPSTGKFTNLVNDDFDKESLNNNSIYSLYKDAEGNIWIGTYTGGVNAYFKSYNTFEHFRKKSGREQLNHNSITSFAQDHSGNLWIGTDGGGVNILESNQSRFRHHQFQRGNDTTLGADYVMGVSTDSAKNMWIGTWGGGLNRYDFDTGKFTRYQRNPDNEGAINSNNVSMAYQDSKGNLWVGTFGGGLNLFDYETGTFTNYTNEPGNLLSISNNHVVNILEGDNGLLWLGTDGGGINMMRRNHTFRQFLGIEDNRRGLRNGNILSSLKDEKGGLWFGTNKGLHKLNPEALQFHYYAMDDSLSELRVLGIEEDIHNNLWISSNNGLMVFNPESGYFRRFTTAHGLQDIEFSRGASFEDKDGYLYFGGINGFNRFHPDSVDIAIKAPSIEIVDFEIFNKSVKIGEMDSLLKKSITETSYIEIPWRYSMFSMRYAALNYNFTTDIEYAYKLENFDKEWYFVGKNRKATYTNLNPGRYVFKIKCKIDGAWGKEQRKLEIVILPPFWQTFWFRSLVVLFVLLIFALFYRSRLQRIKKLNRLVEKRTEEIRQKNEVLEDQKQQLLEINVKLTERQEQIEMQARELIRQRNELKQTNATKDKFLSIIAHDLRNPFNTIIGFSELLLSDLDSFERSEVENQLKQILRAGEQTYSLLEDLLMWANSQSGKLNARTEEVDSREVCLNVMELMKDQADRKNIEISCNTLETVLVKADRFMLTTVIRNLLSNAIKFTEQRGNVMLSVVRKHNEAVVTVADTGVGIDEKNLLKLWDVAGHTSHAGTENEQGSGLGLLLCKEFVEKQGGKITVQSRVGKGSVFEFTIPLAD